MMIIFLVGTLKYSARTRYLLDYFSKVDVVKCPDRQSSRSCLSPGLCVRTVLTKSGNRLGKQFLRLYCFTTNQRIRTLLREQNLIVKHETNVTLCLDYVARKTEKIIKMFYSVYLLFSPYLVDTF